MGLMLIFFRMFKKVLIYVDHSFASWYDDGGAPQFSSKHKSNGIRNEHEHDASLPKRASPQGEGD